MTFHQLQRGVDYIRRSLIGHGFSKSDRIALVLPNGPEMAVAFMGVSTAAISAPLNPAHQAPEFEFFLSRLGARAVIYLSGARTPAVEVARSLNIRLVPITPILTAAAGVFRFASDDPAQDVTAARSRREQPEDVALVLHTSGTIARPKFVPLTHRNLCRSTENICASLKLTPHDRCLSIMPLFHAHGLIGAVLASVRAGASVVCTSGFAERDFYAWLDEFQPSWFTAAPSMHHAIVLGARSHREIIGRRPLRFIRSCSAPLSPRLMAEMEQTFAAPVLEAYGMTEASHQIASNPLPPLPRKPGSVGIPTGPQVGVMDETGNLLPPRATGEVVVQGATVTTGYENDPGANRAVFANGWFRTGDQGWIDEEGYLYLTGRLKELINRGGEKISPREVDETLLGHPAVRQAAAFAVPHPRLGEDIAAAIVLKTGAGATEKELRQYVASSLADYKVPRRIVFVNEIATGASGKLQRTELARTLCALLSVEFVPPSAPCEEALARIWCDVLGVPKVGVHDNFFDLGGDSLLLTTLVAKVRETYTNEFPLEVAFLEPTVAGMARHIQASAEHETASPADLSRPWEGVKNGNPIVQTRYSR